MKSVAIFLSICLLLACGKKTEESMIPSPTSISNPSPGSNLTYLALGDSYTIGESVPQKDAFPFQLTTRLNGMGLKFPSDPKIIATTGWTTGQLIEAIKLDQTIASKYDIVTLLIGVNNQFRGYSITEYRKEFVSLLVTAIIFAGGNKKHVFVVSIPDWGATPFGQSIGKDPKIIAAEIDAFNAVNREETLKLGLSYTDITPASRNATTDLTLIASDGLHPSGKMYAEWVAALAPKVAASF